MPPAGRIPDNYFLPKPEQIKVSLTNLCNFRCVMCINPDLVQPRGFIAEDLVKKIIDECAEEGIPKISLGGTGEPLLHKQFTDFLAYAKSRHLWVSTTTNGSLLDPERSEAILRAGIDRIHISLYSASPDEHLAYTKTKTFETVESNLRAFLDLWAAYGKTCDVGFSFLDIQGINQKERFMSYWRPLFFRFGLSVGHHNIDNWAGLRIDILRPSRNLRRISCPQIQKYIFVLHSGDVLPCTNIMEASKGLNSYFGNVNESSIMAIWNSDGYIAFKRAHVNKMLSDYPHCMNCSVPFVTNPTFLQKIRYKLGDFIQ